MNYKIIIYILGVMFSMFAITSLDINHIFKQGKVIEANIFVFLIILALAELVSSFIINFLEVSKII